jgi:hypothetical protein
MTRQDHCDGYPRLGILTFASRSLIMFDGKIVEEANSHDLSGKLTGFKKLFGEVYKQ